MRLIFSVGLLLLSSMAFADSPKILHQTQNSLIVRMGADDGHVVWQEVGGKKPENYLFTLNTRTGIKEEIRYSKRPFAPAVAGSMLLFGAGKLHQKIDVVLSSLDGHKSFRLHKEIPWIVETGIQAHDGRIQAVWERPTNDNGDGLAIYMWIGDLQGKGELKMLVNGPVVRTDIPKEYQHLVHNEYPKIDGDSIAFQSNEYSSPNIYRKNFVTGATIRLSPSGMFQERPSISGPYIVWEESENGFSVSNISSIYAHDLRDGSVKMLNAEKGFHYQARVFGKYAIYGAKRAPLLHTPSIRIYDLERGIELSADKCFAGSIFDFVPVKDGVFAAQRMANATSRLLFATWEQLNRECR